MGEVSYSIDGALRDAVRRMIMLDAAYALRSHEYSVLGGYNRLLGRLEMAFVVGAVTSGEFASLSGDICRLGVNDNAGRHAAEREALADSCMNAREAGGWMYEKGKEVSIW